MTQGQFFKRSLTGLNSDFPSSRLVALPRLKNLPYYFTHSWRENNWIHTFPKGISAEKCNQSRPGFELVSPCPFPTTITITPRAPPLKDTKQVKETSKTLQEGPNKIHLCPLQEKYKVWCLQYVFIQMLLWPLLVYEISTNAVEVMEAKINKYTRNGVTSRFVWCCNVLQTSKTEVANEIDNGGIQIQSDFKWC